MLRMLFQILAADLRRCPFLKGLSVRTWGCLRMTVVQEWIMETAGDDGRWKA